jgi:hypothetical protein
MSDFNNHVFVVNPGGGLIIPSQGANFLYLRGIMGVEHRRLFNGVKRLITKFNIKNMITNAGKNYVLGAAFAGVTQISQASWCISIIDNAGYSAVNATDTMASHSTWNEFTQYSQTTRVAWGPGSPSAQQITNATACTFDITATTGTLQGIFICSNNTISGTTGTLWSTALFPSTIPVTNGDEIKVTYSVAC